MRGLGEFLGRAPFVFLGAIGIFSIVGTFTTLDADIYQTLEAWRKVTRPIWDYTLGMVFSFFGWRLPEIAKDYLTIGLITMGMQYRGARQLYLSILEIEGTVFERSMSVRKLTPGILEFWFILLFWPPYFLSRAIPIRPPDFYNESWRKVWTQNRRQGDFPGGLEGWEIVRQASENATYEARVESQKSFWEVAVWAMILIGVNYALIGFFDRPSVPPDFDIWADGITLTPLRNLDR